MAHAADAAQARLEQGRPVEMAEVEAALRMGVETAPEGPSPAEQLEMFQSGPIELRTRKKTIEPRTDAQKDYVRALFGSPADEAFAETLVERLLAR